MLVFLLRTRRIHRGARIAGKILRYQFKLIGTIVELVEKYQTRETSAEAVPRALTTAPPRDRGFWTFGRRARLV